MTIRRKTLKMASTALVSLIALAAPAAAHENVLLDQTDIVPWVAPLALDGTNFVGFFGTLEHPQVRSAQFNMEAGQPISMTLAVPNLAPENQLATADLPKIILVAPDFSFTVLEPTMRIPVNNVEGSGMNVLVLLRYGATAMTGTYSMLVVGGAPARFAVLLGVSEEFDGIRRGEVATPQEILEEWYNNPPG